MGQKVNPHGLRVGVIKDWDSKWYADKKNFSLNLSEDYKIREYIKETFFQAGIAKIEIERFASRIKVSVFTAKPGMIIGKGGSGVEQLKKHVEELTGKTVIINVEEVKVPELNGQLVAENIASQLEKRISFRRAMKQSMQRTMKMGAVGIKTSASGRLNGADMARTEGYNDGKIPLHTLRADISYGFAEANTTFGKVGIKVWICRGEILKKSGSLLSDNQEPTKAPRDSRDNRKKRRPNNNFKRDKK
ncbi:30S ribosomal protein S3 [Sedimentibacter sp. MB31-C6]|uniref:30S ribosomal protein S3 n=1 Tax=Sedimentibacter sp. MB31-C6 TaxID=3109366 RepID=UPI002DDD7C09|nr:30S ribosomal protein S3 [Sedimentibacter sp. MB36-C1]WSI03863.1 30S ribosomal protein S3 [Sedimentibacter sp. MB36-C1]